MNLVAFLSYVFIGTLTPGPNNIMAMSNASRFGLRKSIRFNLGIVTGFFCVIGICGLFTSILYKYIPTIKPVMNILGAAYILFLAYKIFKSKGNNDNEKNNTNSFFYGLILQFINPKAIIYGITTMSTFVIPNINSLGYIILVTAFLSFVALIATLLWACFGSIFQKILRNHREVINIIMSLLLVYCAISLLM